jgi:hypothetical protein
MHANLKSISLGGSGFPLHHARCSRLTSGRVALFACMHSQSAVGAAKVSGICLLSRNLLSWTRLDQVGLSFFLAMH